MRLTLRVGAKQSWAQPRRKTCQYCKPQPAAAPAADKSQAKKSPGLGNNRPDSAKSACGWWDQLDDEGTPVRLVYCKVIQGHGPDQHMWARAVPPIPSA